jgi:hypothetical protein
MTSTGPPFAGAAVVETLRSSPGFPEQGPCRFGVWVPSVRAPIQDFHLRSVVHASRTPTSRCAAFGSFPLPS